METKPLNDLHISAIAEIMAQRIVNLTAEREILLTRITAIDAELQRLKPALAALDEVQLTIAGLGNKRKEAE